MQEKRRGVRETILRNKTIHYLLNDRVIPAAGETVAVSEDLANDQRANEILLTTNGFDRFFLMLYATGAEVDGFNVTVSYWDEDRKVAADDTVAISTITNGGDFWNITELVATNDSDAFNKSEYIKLSFEFPVESGDYVINARLKKTLLQ